LLEPKIPTIRLPDDQAAKDIPDPSDLLHPEILPARDDSKRHLPGGL